MNSPTPAADFQASTGSDADSQPKGRAIVTFGRGWHSLAVARSLAAKGIEVISADVYGLTPGALSKHTTDSFTYPDPSEEPEQFLDVLESEIRQRRPEDGVPYVLQPVQQETYLISKHRERFKGLIDLALPDNDLLDRVRDKGELAAMASEIGLNVPTTWRFDETPTPEQLARVDVPAIIKIPRGAGGVGMVRVDRHDELATAYEQIYEKHGTLPLIQEIVEGEDICVTAICDQGRVHALMTYRNRHKAASSAPGSVRETIAAPAAEQATETLLSELGWHGVAQLDFMWDGESEPWLIEINPRLFGGVFQTVASGIDFPWILFCLASGLPLPKPVQPELGVRTETPVVGFLSILREMLADDENSTLFDELSSAWRSSRMVSSLGGISAGMNAFLSQTAEILNPTERWERIQELFDENEDNISQLMFTSDPTASLGLLYPLAIFLKHGRIDEELLHGSSPVDDEASLEKVEEEVGRS